MILKLFIKVNVKFMIQLIYRLLLLKRLIEKNILCSLFKIIQKKKIKLFMMKIKYKTLIKEIIIKQFHYS